MTERTVRRVLEPPADPPGSSPRARRLVRRVLGPVERFLALEAASGIVLLFATLASLVWANSPWADSYHRLWNQPVAFRVADWGFERSVHFWINDGLMTVFFLVVGLEIRREIDGGELRDLPRAALPFFAAIGGMIVPALLFAAFNHGRATAGGWGIPMATDIAFAVGVFAALGRRVSHSARVLLLALAVIDDIGAVLVIAIFYSTSLVPTGFAVAAGGVATTLAFQKIGIRSAGAYLIPGTLLWAGAYVAGIHPTLAGVALGLMTPVRAWYPSGWLAAEVERRLHGARERDLSSNSDLADLARTAGEEFSPLERLERVLHGWVAFLIMPLFALANAGVPLGGVDLRGDAAALFVGITLGLLVGKPIGVLVASKLGVRFGLVAIPPGLPRRHLLLVGTVAGIGFTMSLFVAQLALPAGPLLDTAKLAILVASSLAAIAGALLGRFASSS